MRVKYNYLIFESQAEKETTYAAVVGIKKCEGVAHLKKALEEVMALGGEGNHRSVKLLLILLT